MRRREKEITDSNRIADLLARAAVCRLAIHDSAFPYVVPLNFVFIGSCLYFHSAREGKKLDLIRLNGHVGFEVDTQFAILSAEQACGWGTDFESIIGKGIASVVADETERDMALRKLMLKYSGREDWVFASENTEKIAVVRVRVIGMTGKASVSNRNYT
ncbi:MAG TPA: pyridoxamine 5'-phosphate oxidase family protein [Spirochaetia bacterium]|nr:pyridoxamine 5'-phosphate oxidase family protein [Spirochaetia bacterium]